MTMRVASGLFLVLGACSGFVHFPTGASFTRNALALRSTPQLQQDENEIKLGELIFSSRDPRLDVATSPHLYDEEFCNYVTKLADDSDDIEERVALKSLVDMVQKVQKQLREAAEEVAYEEADVVEVSGEDVTVQRAESTADILSAANAAIGGGLTMEKKEAVEEASEAGLSGSALATYDALLARLMAADEKGKLEVEVEANYDICDYSLLSLASSRAESSSSEEYSSSVSRIVEAVNALAAKRLESAAGRLQSVLRAGAPEKMMQKVTELAATGGLDGPLLELLEANRQQAQAAGPAGAQAAELMGRLASRCRDEMDKLVDPEKKLLRALLRADDQESREKLLRRAFEPKEALELSFDGRKTEGGPDVEPPKFIAACTKMIADFGNVEFGDAQLSDTIRGIAALAETVAIDIFGESNTPREQQDRVWSEQTTSVFELEAAELQAESQGERAPWSNDAYDDMMPPGFDQATGIKRVGGG